MPFPCLFFLLFVFSTVLKLVEHRVLIETCMIKNRQGHWSKIAVNYIYSMVKNIVGL